jgi:hypothetical protein
MTGKLIVFLAFVTAAVSTLAARCSPRSFSWRATASRWLFGIGRNLFAQSRSAVLIEHHSGEKKTWHSSLLSSLQ